MRCENQQARSICNLTRKGQRIRFLLGIGGAIAVVAAGAALLAVDAEPLWRMSLFLPMTASILCLLEAYSSTCIILAALGAWDVGFGTQRIPDAGLESMLRHRAWRLAGFSALVSLAICLAFLLF
jgi:hypothetical protein